MCPVPVRLHTPSTPSRSLPAGAPWPPSSWPGWPARLSSSPCWARTSTGSAPGRGCRSWASWSGRASREQPTRRAVTLVEDAGERTITTFGERLDPLGAEGGGHWSGVEQAEAVYFTAGDRDALQIARETARVLVASPRARHALGGGVRLDALVLSGEDEIELSEASACRSRGRRWLSSPRARTAVASASARAARVAGRPLRSPGRRSTPMAVATPSRPVSPTGSAAGLALAGALGLAARCGARCLTGARPL